VSNGEGIAIQMNKLNNILICVVILLVLFVANGVVGNYLFISSDDDNDSPVLHKVGSLSPSILTNYHSAFQSFFFYHGNIVDDIFPIKNSPPPSIRD
jgi:hypothetical protein